MISKLLNLYRDPFQGCDTRLKYEKRSELIIIGFWIACALISTGYSVGYILATR